jgi:four helix bundle protein
MKSPLLEKSLDFATKIVLFYETFSKTKKDTTIAKQLLRSATSVGANINEAVYGNSKADFISKLHIALKETGESIYWLTLLKKTNLIDYKYDELLILAEEIKRMLIASLNTAKENKKAIDNVRKNTEVDKMND